MPNITLDEAKKNYQLWRNAEQALATGQSYKIGSRSLTRTNMDIVLERIRYWGRIVESLENPSMRRRTRTRAVTPFDI